MSSLSRSYRNRPGFRNGEEVQARGKCIGQNLSKHNKTRPVLGCLCREQWEKAWCSNLFFLQPEEPHEETQHLTALSSLFNCNSRKPFILYFPPPLPSLLPSLVLLLISSLSVSLHPAPPLPSPLPSLPSLAVNEWTVCSLNTTLGNTIAFRRLNGAECHNERKQQKNNTTAQNAVVLHFEKRHTHKLRSLCCQLYSC